MAPLIRTAAVVCLAAVAAPLEGQQPHAHGVPRADSAAAHAAAPMVGLMAGPLGIPRTRYGSGTSWLPDASPMYAWHTAAGSWTLMVHGNVFLEYIRQGGARGADQLGSINWAMGVARRPLAGGELGLRAMMSAEPLAVGECGYPLLLQTGEACKGAPIHDRQHPHDLFMELSVLYQRALGPNLGVQLYGGPVAEPALGPVAFPHRISANADPLAPITHHWLDATHISFGVATAGLFGRRWKAEASLFNGREPDANRYDFDLAPLDSYSGRFSVLPNDRWALQVSAGRLIHAEPARDGRPGEDVNRYTASAMYQAPRPDGGYWSATAAWGRNAHDGESSDALLGEATLSLAERNVFFARAEWVRKSADELVLYPGALPPRDADRTFGVSAAVLGYSHQFSAGPALLSVGARVSVAFLPAELEPAYGSRSPRGLTIFTQLRPKPTAMGDAMMPRMP